MQKQFNDAGALPVVQKADNHSVYELDSPNTMFVHVYKPDGACDGAKLAFVQHGRNGKAESMEPVIKPYLEQGYIVVAPDARNSRWNDSAGQAEDFTIQAHIDDLRRTIEFAQENRDLIGWTSDEFALAGFSMGGFATSYLAATEFKDRVTHLMVTAPFTSGDHQLEARRDIPNGIENLKKEVPQAMDEWPTHNIFDHAHNLTMPVVVLVGEIDCVTPAKHVGQLAEAVRNNGSLVHYEVLKGRHHYVHDNGDNIHDYYVGKIQDMEKAARDKKLDLIVLPDAAPEQDL